MKVLLLGEFSGLHDNLAKGLRYHDIDVTTASFGDGWKKILSDYDWSCNINGLTGRGISFLKAFKDVRKLTDYDVVQIISPVLVPPKFNILNNLLIKFLSKNNNKLFLVGAGASERNNIINDFYRESYIYPDFYHAIKSVSNGYLWSETAQGIKYNENLHNIIAGYIPIMYEYAEPYRQINFNKLKKTIQIPFINNNRFSFKKLQGRKLRVFHGLSGRRAKLKGSDIIVPVMEDLSGKFGKHVDFISQGGLPLNQYLDCLNAADVVIDQAYAVSYGINAVHAMSLGKVVMGGGQKEFLNEFNLESSPVVSFFPSAKSIYSVLDQLLSESHLIEDKSLSSYNFVNDFHDGRKVAISYLSEWN